MEGSGVIRGVSCRALLLKSVGLVHVDRVPRGLPSLSVELE